GAARRTRRRSGAPALLDRVGARRDRPIPGAQGRRRFVALSARAPEAVSTSPAPGKRAARWMFLAILAAAAVLRFPAVNWDEGHHLHPDERFISMVEENVGFPGGIRAYFDSAASPLNPYNHRYDSFPYGTLPMFLSKVVATRLHRDDYGHANLVGRALSGVF